MSHPAMLITDAGLGPAGPTIRWVNPEFEKMTGYDASELIGRKPSMLQGEKTSKAALAVLRRAIRAGVTHRTVLVNYRKNGEPYLCDIEIRPIFDDVGKVLCFLAIESETHRKRGRPPGRLKLSSGP
ncbi:PAS domain-containing protein [Caulobacter henricii]|uniref:PAS domain-containing protein n=1 Tax=Caulobacter henricii TaxID=69395 RepID=A0A0P0NWY8_9CAUL|nr:PAS domain-containing protein [Caulobacter henricii]ALL12535.1 hypothetical protein AQ619_03730 [Caulobacter henricii]